MAKRILIAIALLLAAGQACAQILPFRSYSIEKGLSEAVVNDLMQDDHGYLWIATSYGLNRFDGIQFRNYYEEDGLLANKIYSLYKDGNRIWIGTIAGANMMEDGTIRTIPELDPLTSATILEIFRDSRGDYWFATDGQGVWRWDEGGSSLDRFSVEDGLAGDRVRDVLEGENGTIWLGTREGLSGYDGGTFTNYTTEHGLPDNRIRDLMWGPGGSLWVATRGGLSRMDGNSFSTLTESDGLVNNRVQSLSPDGEGGIWIGTEEGASHFTADGRFKNYSVEQGLSNNIIYSTLLDREQNIWFGTFGGGVNLFLGDHIMNYTVEEGLPNNVITDIVQDEEGNHWITTYGGGISRFDGRTFTVFNEATGLVDNKVYTVINDSRDRLLVGTRWGLSIYEDGRFYNFDETELPYRKIRAIAESGTEGLYWMGTYGEGALRYRDNRFELISESEGLANNTVMSVAEDDSGAVWFATYGGVSRYYDGTFSNFTLQEGLPNNGILDIHIAENGDLWVATFGGIARYANGRFTSVTAEEGLPDEVCYFLLQDRRGIFWIGTNRGIVRFDYDKYRAADGDEEARQQSFKLITQDQGLVANEMNAGASYLDREGNLWFGSVGGVTRLDPSREKINSAPPKVHITNVRVSEQPVPNYKNIQIASDERNLMIEFVGINFTAPEQVLYKYRLKNSGESWQQTTQRKVRYSALLPGEYEFQLLARNSDGMWSPERAIVSFTVQAPFWMRWWFIVLVILTVSGIIYFFYHYYHVRKMFEIERMRVRIASDLHDDVGSSLTEIALQTDFLQTTDLSEEVRSSLNQIGQQSRKIVNSLDDIVWSIDARNDTLGDLTDRMQDYVNHMLQDRQVSYHFEDLDMDQKLTVPLKENIYLIFKEAINNIAKHSDATKVEIRMKNGNGTFDLYIHDNGSGMRSHARKSGHGLRNMKLRAQRIDAGIEFTNSEGFTVHVYGKQN